MSVVSVSTWPDSLNRFAAFTIKFFSPFGMPEVFGSSHIGLSYMKGNHFGKVFTLCALYSLLTAE